jgi:glycosyltransferase involved in cell wall biosynthesis
MDKLLSICIPTIVGREKQYNQLYSFIAEQCTNDVEIVTLKDNRELSIGKKRQSMYEMCTGQYAVQIDDDDTIPADYISTVLKLLAVNPDCVGYLERVEDRGVHLLACHSNRYTDWGNNKDGYSYVRTIFYKDVIKTEIAKAVVVKDMRYGEDHDFARRLKASGLLKTEVFIEKIMYFYAAPVLTAATTKERYGI